MPYKIKPHKKPVRKPDNRPNATDRGYGPLWKRISKAYKENNPRCEICHINQSQIVHHRIPLKQGGSNDVSNLVAVCRHCHERIHKGKL